jgi:PleD family two-component response regulator
LPVKVSQLKPNPTIEVTVDLVLVKQEFTMTSAAPTLDLGKQAAGNPTILIIEDYPDTRQMIAMLLSRRGYNVIEAADGVEGLVQATWKHPDLILMDLALPEMDGSNSKNSLNAETGGHTDHRSKCI